ncbi:hypothetical protein FRZ61_06570 [Hypericibacter adhaerens]|uniref:Uncharacterized protein n=1 Tax=Hypericibacter adhaerens TaxID=2602016 RepID=A0A5J6MT23_9PROT|nr:hypothetical protein FRZ61_06570 [Hypericibacter adhaerens]
MRKEPRDQKRPADVIGNAVKVMRIATGQAEERAPRCFESKPAFKTLPATATFLCCITTTVRYRSN